VQLARCHAGRARRPVGDILAQQRRRDATLIDDRRLTRAIGIVVPVAVWVLGMVPGPTRGLTIDYVITFTLLLVGMIVVDLAMPLEDPGAAAWWRRGGCLIAELILGFLVVQVHGSLIRPALIYLLPASRAILLFGERRGLIASASVWLAYGVNVALYAWPDRLGEFANYFAFFLAPYALAVVLTLGQLRQAAARKHVQTLYDQLRTAHAELQELHAVTREAAVTQERDRLAREIHDSLAHYLTIVNVQLEAAEKLPDHARSREQVIRARRLTLECLQDVRQSVAALRASTLDELSLPRALRKLAEEFAATSGLQVKLNLDSADDAAIGPQHTLALFRVAQEGLTNVQRHACAQRVVITLCRTPDGALSLTVEDDGVGPLDAERTPNGSSFGLIGLRERVELLGGRLGFDRGKYGGARLSVVIP
jgi:signal transduction histidine kinase